MLRGAIIGVGNVALRGHLPAWRDRAGAAIVAASDTHESGRRELDSLVPGIAWHASAEELLGSVELDFVDICTPPATHAELSRLALERGLHVLCEKPLVIRPEELPPLAQASARNDTVLCTVHNWRHAPILAKASDLVGQGAVGRVRRCFWQTLRREPAAAAGTEDNWRLDPKASGGGILVDHGWHAFYLLGEWLPKPPRGMKAALENRRSSGLTEDTATVILECEGASGEIFLTWASEERANRVLIEGTGGKIGLDGKTLELSGPGGSNVRRWDFPRSLTEGSHHPDWFGGVIEEFFQEIEDRGARGRNLSRAALCAELVAAGYESNRRNGQSVPVSGRLRLPEQP